MTFDFKKEVGEKLFHFQGKVSDPITSIIGPSGAGKTTFARCLAGFERPDTGRIEVNGSVYFDAARRCFVSVEKRGVGFVFQTRRLFPHFSVRENILLSARWAGRRIPKNFDEMLDVLAIRDLLERMPDSLSGGQAQRVEIARSVVASEHLLIMDEPLSGLDPYLSWQILDCIVQLPSLLDLRILYITHHPQEARTVSRSALLIHGGRIAYQGAVNTALSHPLYQGEKDENRMG